ncbi:phenylacetate--CoA ligase family protein [Pseudoclavibacter endophyticus]|uniref:Phenylacetate--CoA ligase family protein n=1 Tax=Pseudoclavibacter endophyticus TaxID=1778590 RepID=A0A6H9WUU7_9MICO|nr:phenylacetate--CoA ligase family protein [Pseudoclavibacter endophyticus]
MLRTSSRAVTNISELYRVHPAIWRWTARHFHPGLERFARLNAWMICQMANLDVPAYQKWLREHDFVFRWWKLDNYPETDKRGYVTRYSEDERCWNGEIVTIGTVVDESSGSSGTPFNWMRGKKEQRTIHSNVAGYVTLLFGSKRLFCLNAFSMGAWATGTNTGQAMSKIAMVKNTGPDLDKIVDTIRHFGPRFTYLVAAYPPFLKHLRDRLDQEEWFDWSRYRMNGFVGGEAMTEGLRDYVEERFGRVYSGYGASDLTIGMGGESDVSVWLRRSMYADDRVRAALLGPDETRIPMVFQYNPIETYLEINEHDEVVVTLNSTAIMSPKLRYNIGDEGRIATFPEVYAALAFDPELQRAFHRAFAVQRMKLPFLFLFGRKDSTISYMGANLYPIDVENGLYRDNPFAPSIESFKLALIEVGDHEQRPLVHVQLRSGASLDAAHRESLAVAAKRGVVSHLASVSRDFAQSLEEDASTADIRVEVHDFDTGPFAGGSTKIKNVYVVES